MPLGGGSCCVETNRLVCVVGRLTDFCMISFFTESFFPNRLFNCSYQFHLLELSLGFYDAFCLCCRYLWTTALDEFIIFIITIIIHFVIIIIIDTITILIFIIIIIIITIMIVNIIISVTYHYFFILLLLLIFGS